MALHSMLAIFSKSDNSPARRDADAFFTGRPAKIGTACREPPIDLAGFEAQVCRILAGSERSLRMSGSDCGAAR